MKSDSRIESLIALGGAVLIILAMLYVMIW